MKLAKAFFYFLLFTSAICIYVMSNSGCAQVGAPTGGPKDTLPPVLVIANPPMHTINFKGNKIVFTFDEYIDLDQPNSNVLISPYPKKTANVTNNLKTLTVKLKDTLLANTTYTIDFGKAIKDVNEGNVLKNFYYVFSTGNTIDSMAIIGNVVEAETGKVDSTLIVTLYKNLVDTAVENFRPNYVARLDGKGRFVFRNLPPGDFNIYAVSDDNGNKTYSSKSQDFAFCDSVIHVSDSIQSVTLYAYAEEKKPEKQKTTTNQTSAKSKAPKETKLRFNTSLEKNKQDLLSDLQLTFNHTLKDFDSTEIYLTDTFYKPFKNAIVTIDTTRKIVSIKNAWVENTDYRLIIDTAAVSDSSNTRLRKIDTLSFETEQQSEYGSILIRITNFDKSKHPVLLFVQSDKIVKSVPMNSAEWSDNIFEPGNYEVRVLFDRNENGKWDPGDYEKKIQPEIVIQADKKLSIKADWDNEREIHL